jgi:hypothetical protein
MHNARVYGFNKFGVAPTAIANSIALPSAASAWTGGAVDDSVGYRYFWIYGLDARISSNPEVWPVLLLGEVELYGELTIAPEVELDYSYNGMPMARFITLALVAEAGRGAILTPRVTLKSPCRMTRWRWALLIRWSIGNRRTPTWSTATIPRFGSTWAKIEASSSQR